MNKKDILYPFRKGTVRQPKERRIQKYAHRPLSSFNVMRCYATMFIMPPSALVSFRYVWTAARKFFIFQYLQKIHLLHVPVKHVDHELDEKIPFRPELQPVYLDFINYWIRGMSMMECRFGLYEGSKLCAEFVHYIKLAYDEAYRMYSYCMTTTYRPPCSMKRIKAMRNADPHFLCVPSLHIAVICLTYSFYKMIFEREHFTQEEKDNWSRELYDYGLQIAESVLYLKQHSVNCIPAAMYMMTHIAPELFTTQDAVNFIRDMFSKAADIAPQDKENIFNHMNFIYERFLLEGVTEEDWRTPVIRWLDEYEPYTPAEDTQA